MRIALVGIGNCACSLVQALESAARDGNQPPTLVAGLGEYDPGTFEIVAAFDVDTRKIGRRLHEAIFAPPNCTTRYRTPKFGENVVVSPGPLLDGVDGPLRDVVRVGDVTRDTTVEDVVETLTAARATTMVLFLPVGAQQAAECYAEAAIRAGCGLVNCTPAVLANSPRWHAKFAERKLHLIGDDLKSHVGSTTIHQALLKTLTERRANVVSTYQLNVGGNTDFLNMSSPARAAAKRATKTTSLAGIVGPNVALGAGPSDHILQLRDHKVGYIRIEGTACLGAPFSIEVRLEVEDSPNAAPVAIDAIRFAAALRSGRDMDLESAGELLFKAPALTPAGKDEPETAGLNRDQPMLQPGATAAEGPPRRVLVVGNPGSGKSLLAQHLSGSLSLPWVELDRFFWESDWVRASPERFLGRLRQATREGAWIVDGVYPQALEALAEDAQLYVWLDLGLPRLFVRVLARSVKRIIRRTPICGRNRERWRDLFGPDSLPLYLVRSYRQQRALFDDLARRLDVSPTCRVARLRSAKAIRRWLRAQSPTHSDPPRRWASNHSGTPANLTGDHTTRTTEIERRTTTC